MGFGIPLDTFELIADSADSDCGCAQDPPFTTTFSGLAEVAPLLMLPSAAVFAVIGLVTWARTRNRGVTPRQGAWFGVWVSGVIAVVLFVVAMTANVSFDGWSELDWPVILGSTLTAILLAPLSALAGWTIVRVQQPRIRATDTPDETPAATPAQSRTES